MKKYIKYLILIFPYIVTVTYFILMYKEITLITYLLIMIMPMIFSGIIIGLGYSKELFRERANTMALLCTAIYFLYYILIIEIIEKYKIYKFLYTNSKQLFVEGFSIGSKISTDIVDALLPCCMCFCIHRLCIKYSDKLKRKAK